MAYRAIQRQPSIAARIEGTFAMYDEACDEVEAAGFELEDYRIESDCPSCGTWYAEDETHHCTPVVVGLAGWQPYEPGSGRLRNPSRLVPNVERGRRPVRRRRNTRYTVVLKEYQSRLVTTYALELGLMVSSKPFDCDGGRVVITVYGTKRRVYNFEGYVTRVNG